MSSGFVPAGTTSSNDKPPPPPPTTSADSWAAAEHSIQVARWQQENPVSSSSGDVPEKSLYEILQANKARKQEEFEEKLKFKNQFKALDEDDVEFLDSIMSEQARAEQLRKQELASQLEGFRKAQYEAETAENTEALDNIPKVEDVVIGGWGTSGRKRKKFSHGRDNNGGGTAAGGPKIRKIVGGSGAPPPALGKRVGVDMQKQKSNEGPKPALQATARAAKPDGPPPDKKKKLQDDEVQAPVQEVGSPPKGDITTKSLPPKPAAPTETPGGLFGLVSYSSDED